MEEEAHEASEAQEEKDEGSLQVSCSPQFASVLLSHPASSRACVPRVGCPCLPQAYVPLIVIGPLWDVTEPLLDDPRVDRVSAAIASS